MATATGASLGHGAQGAAGSGARAWVTVPDADHHHDPCHGRPWAVMTRVMTIIAPVVPPAPRRWPAGYRRDPWASVSVLVLVHGSAGTAGGVIGPVAPAAPRALPTWAGRAPWTSVSALILVHGRAGATTSPDLPSSAPRCREARADHV